MRNTFSNFELVSYNEAVNFTTNSENRKINRGHLKNLKKQWYSYAAIMPPITVNKLTNHITDGQHRWTSYIDMVKNGELAKDTKIKVMYVNIDPADEKDAIIAANTNSKNWVADDYVASYAKSGNEKYKKLTEWCKSHELACTKTKDEIKPKYIYGAAIITGNQCREELMKGEFSFTDEQLKRAESIHAEMVELKNAMNIQGSNSWVTTLAMSWHDFRGMHDFKAFLKELKNKMRSSYYKKLPKQSKKDFTTIFSQVHSTLDVKAQ